MIAFGDVTQPDAPSVGTNSATGRDPATLSHTTTTDTTLLVVLSGTKRQEYAPILFADPVVTFGAQSLTFINKVVDGDQEGDPGIAAHCLVNPAIGTDTITLDYATAVNPDWIVAINYKGTKTTSCADAIQLLSEDNNNVTSTNTSVHPSEGVSGNALLFVGSGKGADLVPASNNAAFTELVEQETGGGEATADDQSIYVAGKLSGAPSGITVTWAGSDNNVSQYFEVVAESAVVSTAKLFPVLRHPPELPPGGGGGGGEGSFAEMSPGSTIIEGFAVHGADWSSYIATDPTVVYHRVTNTNTSGAGSFEAAINACANNELNVILFETSGMIVYPDNTSEFITCDNLLVLAHTAPSPGIHMRGVKRTIRQSARQLWMHYSCFADSNIEADAGCVQVGGGTGPDITEDVIFMNYGSVFNYDAGMSTWQFQRNSSFVQGMVIYPTDLNDGENPEGILIGHDNTDGSSDFSLVRNITAHTQARTPRWVGRNDGTISNNVYYNNENTWTAIDKIDDAGTDINVIDNLFVYGPESNSIDPINVSLVGDTVNATVDVYLNGNCAFGRADTPNTVMVDDNSGGDLNLVGSLITDATAYVSGYASTPIGACTNANEREFAVDIVCPNAGPRPADRLQIYQDICDQIAARFDGVSGQGGTIGPASDIGYPSVAVNTCDLDIENDCGAGWPALPNEGTVTAQQIIDWSWDVHCALMPEGATGC